MSNPKHLVRTNKLTDAETEAGGSPSVGRVGLFETGRASLFDEASATALSLERWRPKK